MRKRSSVQRAVDPRYDVHYRRPHERKWVAGLDDQGYTLAGAVSVVGPLLRAGMVVMVAPEGYAPNPGELLVFGANPGGGTRGAKLLGRAHSLRYMHRTEGPRVHDFEGVEVIELLPDGSFRVYHPQGKRLWDNL